MTDESSSKRETPTATVRWTITLDRETASYLSTLAVEEKTPDEPNVNRSRTIRRLVNAEWERRQQEKGERR